MPFDWLKRNKQAQAAEPAWVAGRSVDNGLPIMVRVRDEAPADAKRYPYLVSILWRYDGSVNSGLPDPGTLEQMGSCETALYGVEAKDIAVMVACITGDGRREWLWYIRDKTAFMQHLNTALASLPKCPIELEVSDDAEWNAYRMLRQQIK
jgi:uncharacterized protein DUF695